MKRFLLFVICIILSNLSVYSEDSVLTNYKTEYGESSSVKYFEWVDGKMVEVSTPNPDTITFEYHYNPDNLQTRIINPENTEYGNVSGVFSECSISNNDDTRGAAILNNGTIGDINADFIKNNALYNYSGNGIIYNTGNVDNIKGTFMANTSGYGGVIHNEGTIKSISADFIGNGEMYNSAPIHNSGIIDSINGIFIGNTSDTSSAIYNFGTINNVKGDFIGNFGTAIYNFGTIGNITGNFIENSYFLEASNPGGFGGAIYLNGEAGSSGSVTGGIINSNFIGNHFDTTNGAPIGGAIVTSVNLNIIADNGTSTFKGNYTTDYNGSKKDEAIFVITSYFDNMSLKPDDRANELNFISKNNGRIYMHDSINGGGIYTSWYYGDMNCSIISGELYNVNITGDNTGMFGLYNDIYNANVTLGNTTLSTINDNIHVNHFESFTMSNNANMLLDVDLANQQMDRITAGSYGTHKGVLNVSGMNLLSDSTEERTEIMFAEAGLKDNVKTSLRETNKDCQTTAHTPIYKYGINYDNREDGGYFVFTKGGAPSDNPSDKFNPAVLDSPVAAQSGAQSAIGETVRFAFQHMDTFSQMPYVERMAMINQNRYAIKDVTPKYSSDFDIVNKGYWIRPYTSFERINLHNGPDVDAITYGTLVGLDSDFRAMKNGWYNVQSVYAGYNGSSLSYSGVNTDLNGGLFGLTETFYKNNFFGALTATAGGSFANSSTMYGNEDYAMLLAGLGAKTGYNFEFKNGKYILQPIVFTNYSFVNTFDYTNSAGVKMSSTPLHALQINPQLKFVSNLKNGWQPYASVGLVWNVLNSSKVKANDVVLPKMTVDPYVEYGIGIQRNWKDKFTGFGQAMVRNGGRNGVALTFGFRWALGKETL